MSSSYVKPGRLWLVCLLVAVASGPARAAEPRLQILSPKDGARVTHEQNAVLVSGKVAVEGVRSAAVDIMLVLDVSGSTAQYAGVDFGEYNRMPEGAGSGTGAPQITIFGGAFGFGNPSPRNLRNSILAAEVAAARRLLAQLNPETTRLGVVTFGEGAQLRQPLTHDFAQVERALDDVLRAGPYGGTNMVEGIRTGIKELIGLGASEKRADAIKVQFLLTDGFPTLPIGGGKRPTPEDTDLTINAARLAGKAGIKVHVFALGQEALSYPRAAVGAARESGGTYTPVSRPADVLAVVENISVVGVDYVQVVNETLGQKATLIRLAADGFFSSSVPVNPGANRIQVIARGNNGSTARESITVHYQPGGQRSLDLEVFLEKERSLRLEIERLGKDERQIKQEVERDRQEGLKRSPQLPPGTEGPTR
ncbi:MAG TPA: VWA domain-containing protein [candidate division Zixibacteria bacterium]|nr:VWA domain-containing protein [candidate division Zixibacteria bacterium]